MREEQLAQMETQEGDQSVKYSQTDLLLLIFWISLYHRTSVQVTKDEKVESGVLHDHAQKNRMKLKSLDQTQTTWNIFKGYSKGKYTQTFD